MSYDINPPFRAEHVGSLLRPKALLEAREKRGKGEITDEQLREAEDAAIRDVVKMQESLGLKSITDGEFRRTFFHTDFLEKLKGIEVQGGISKKFHRVDGDVDFAPPKLVVTGKLGSRDQYRRFRLSEIRHQPDTQTGHSVAHHGALSRRPRRH